MVERIVEWLQAGGYLGVAALMFLENLIPPLPSELIMPSAGFAAARGELSLAGVVIAGSAGSLAGASFWYGIGRWLGGERLRRLAERYGRWLTVGPDDLDHANEWFRRWCGPAVLIGRLVPAVRTLISVPAGIFGMSTARFLLYSGIGTAIWSGALAWAGYALGERHELVADYLNPVATGVIVLLLAWYLYRLVRWKG